MTTPRVGIVMGSTSDWPMMQNTVKILEDFGVPYEVKFLRAHSTAEEALAYSAGAEARGLACIIAGAGGAAHLAGVLAAKCVLPVLGVPIPSKYLRGEDSLLSIVQMPKGIPVATFAIGEGGAANAALHAVSILALTDPELKRKLLAFREAQRRKVLAAELPPAA